MEYASSIEIGKRLKAFRNYKGYTQKELGDIVYVSGSFISSIETGTKSLSPSVLFELEMKLNLNHNWLLYGKGSMQNEDGLTRRFQATINTRVRIIRKNLKMSEEDFAKSLGTGITTSKVREWEEQTMNLCVDDILNISDKFGINTDWLLYGTGESSIDNK